jgi:hypothetical protein
MIHYLYYIGLIVALLVAANVYGIISRGTSLSEERKSNLLTELRMRSREASGHQSFQKYTLAELEEIRSQLRDVAYKKLLGHELLKSEKELFRRFPVSGRIIKNQLKRQSGK